MMCVPGDQTQVARLGSESLYLLNYLLNTHSNLKALLSPRPWQGLEFPRSSWVILTG